MKITKIDTYLVNLGHRNIPYVKVHTDEGIYGIGEAYSCGPDKATAEVIHDFEEWLVGRDPRDIEGLWHLMYAGSRFPGGSVVNAAISGIEHALWDIAGKAANLPVYRLLGGKCRDKVRVYQSPRGSTPEEIADNAVKLIEKYGYTAIKMGPLPGNWQAMPWNQALREAEKRVAAVREAVGPDIDIGLDPHARLFEVSRAMELCQVVAPFRPMFVEEPLRPENYEALAKLAESVRVPLATGEMLYTRYEFRDLIATQAVNIIQPDICLTGGLWEMKKIAAMAEASYMSVAPHNPCGPVATAVNVHFAASTTNFLILEYHADDEGPRRELVDEPVRLVDGYLELPDKPGLGIDLNMDAVERYPFRSWHRPFPLRPDGSLSYQ
ncbi:MAG TPA: galactonate dehydratase [Caldilineaceae bacterium]|nr:galactonate dehydratase [Caldilineaceae bacterium]